MTVYCVVMTSFSVVMALFRVTVITFMTFSIFKGDDDDGGPKGNTQIV